MIDARALLAELNQAARKGAAARGGGGLGGTDGGGSLLSLSSGHSSTVGDLRGAADHADNLRERFHIVSSQSTARPGAIIQLEAIADATQDWQSTLMLHAFQEQLILSEASIPSGHKKVAAQGLITAGMSAMVDLDQSPGGTFREPFYALVAEKTPEGDGGVLMHMWRLVVASEAEGGRAAETEDGGNALSVTLKIICSIFPF